MNMFVLFDRYVNDKLGNNKLETLIDNVLADLFGPKGLSYDQEYKENFKENPTWKLSIWYPDTIDENYEGDTSFELFMNEFESMMEQALSSYFGMSDEDLDANIQGCKIDLNLDPEFTGLSADELDSVRDELKFYQWVKKHKVDYNL